MCLHIIFIRHAKKELSVYVFTKDFLHCCRAPVSFAKMSSKHVLICSVIPSFMIAVGGILLSSSQLTRCIQTSDESSPNNLNCENKLVVSLAISEGQQSGSEILEFEIKSLTDEGNVEYSLEEPVRIVVEKSVVEVNYPLEYAQDFNFQPKEIVKQSSNLSCDDGEHQSDTECGWRYDLDGEYLPLVHHTLNSYL